MAGNSHDRACAVGHEHVVRNPDADFFVVHGVDGAQAFQAHAGLFPDQLGALKLRLFAGFFLVSRDLWEVGYAVFELGQNRMFWEMTI